jgi:hypothetical protein
MKVMLRISSYSCPYPNLQKYYVFLIAYFYSSTELDKSVEQVLPRREEGVGRMWGQGQEGEMTQTMYAHVNKCITKNCCQKKNMKLLGNR